MRLPGAAAYMEALQDPASCFADPELAAAMPALGPLGLPRAVSGNVAVVFRVDGAGGRSWAVRCFVRPVDDERARYDAIRAHLGGLASTWRVPFDLQPCGIRIDGTWWPVLKMDWAPGEPLLSYVARHLWDEAALGYLAARFADLCVRLRAEGVAHGDLQHGNILVAPGGDLRLLDYDGMYVPALAGRSGTERGHRNYQHPGRVVGDFGPGLDSFSAWVIHGSLAALAADPLLWGRLDGGEEALLLRHHDLAEPDRSAAFAAMEASDGAGVARLAGLLRSFLAARPDEVPPLTPALVPELVTGAVQPAGAERDAQVLSAGGPAATVAAGASAMRRSLYDALTAGAAGSPDGATGAREPCDAAPAATFRSDLHDARLTLAAGAAVVTVLLLAVLLGASPLVSLIGALGVSGAALARVQRLFRRTPEAEEARQVGTVLAGPRKAVDEAVAIVDRLSRRRAEVAKAEAAAAGQASTARDRLRELEAEELRGVDADLDLVLAALAERERGVAATERQARTAALHALQAAVIDAQLGQHSLVSAAACGVSDQVVYRLALDDVRTAADFTGVLVEKAGGVVVRRDGRRLQVSGVDQRQAAAMLAWRQRVTGMAQLKVPDALPREQRAAIRAEHDVLRATLGREADGARAAARSRAYEVRARWQVALDAVVQRQKQVETDAARERVELDRELVRARKDAAEAEWRLAEHHDQAGRPAELRLADYLRQVVTVDPFAAVANRRRPSGRGERRVPPRP